MTDAKPSDAGTPDRSPVSPDRWGEAHQGRLQALVELGSRAAEVTLEYFRSDRLEVESKADQSPVTVADRQAESCFREGLKARFPEDSVLGEEHGEHSGSTAYRWIVDPIDGTKSFVAGVPLYSTLVALEYEDRPLAGGIWIPALGEMVVATVGLGCWYRSSPQASWSLSRVSRRSQLDQAIFVTTAVASFDEVQAGKGFQKVQEATWFTRTWGDGYGYLLVATGRADVMIDPIVNAWDVAAIAPVIMEAGGRFTDWNGVVTTRGGNAVGSNGLLHDQILTMLA